MTLEDAKKEGIRIGYSIGEENVLSFTEDQKEKFMSICSEIESETYRQYSPFEFLAKDLNAHRYPDEAWAEYEAGVQSGLEEAWDAYY